MLEKHHIIYEPEWDLTGRTEIALVYILLL